MSDLDALRQQARGLGQSQEISPGKIGTGLALAEGARRLYKGRMGSLTKDITDKLDKFNKQFSTEDGSQSWSNHLYFRGIDLNSASYGEGIPEYKIEWNMSRKDSKALETKLRLQTMGTDFDVYKLIDAVISEFSS